MSEFGLILWGAVLLWRATHSLPSEEGTGVLWVSTGTHSCDAPIQTGWWESIRVEWKLPVVNVAVDHWLSVNWICPPTGRKKNNDERERGPEIKRWQNWDNDDWLFFKKQRKRDQSKESKKVRKRHTLKRRRVFKKRCSQKACKQQKRAQTRDKRLKHTEKRKKESGDEQKEWQVFTKELKI